MNRLAAETAGKDKELATKSTKSTKFKKEKRKEKQVVGNRRTGSYPQPHSFCLSLSFFRGFRGFRGKKSVFNEERKAKRKMDCG